MAKYIVTGVAGFIGSAVARALLARKTQADGFNGAVAPDTPDMPDMTGEPVEVVGIDNLSTGCRENVPEGITFIEAQCQDPELYKGGIPAQPYTAIFHIAGQSSGEISFDDPAYDLRTNTESTLHLLKFGLAHQCKRFIYASTMSVYGRQPDKPVAEDAPTFPLSFYGVGKLASEHYLRLYEQFGMRSTALRLFNVYGPGQNMTNMRQGMVSIFMAMLLKNKNIHVKGSPERYRDFVYIDDVVRSFLLCLEKDSSCGQVLNIGGSGRVTVGELIDKLTALSPEEIPVKFEGGTAGDMHGIHSDRSKAAALLGYEPQVSLDEGLRRMYAWAVRRKL